MVQSATEEIEWRPVWAILLAVVGLLASAAGVLWSLHWFLEAGPGYFLVMALAFAAPVLLPCSIAGGVFTSFLRSGGHRKLVIAFAILALALPGLFRVGW